MRLLQDIAVEKYECSIMEVFDEFGLAEMVFGQIPEVEGFEATEPTPIVGVYSEGESAPSRDAEEGGLVKRPPEEEARSVSTSVQMREVFWWENSEGRVFCKNSLPFGTLMDVRKIASRLAD